MVNRGELLGLHNCFQENAWSWKSSGNWTFLLILIEESYLESSSSNHNRDGDIRMWSAAFGWRLSPPIFTSFVAAASDCFGERSNETLAPGVFFFNFINNCISITLCPDGLFLGRRIHLGFNFLAMQDSSQQGFRKPIQLLIGNWGISAPFDLVFFF